MPYRRMPLPGANTYQIFLHLTLAGLAALVLSLVAENRSLRQPASPTPPASPGVGETLPSVAAIDLKGQPIELTFSSTERDTLLLVFTTRCPACLANLPQWLALRDRLAAHYDVIGLSLDDLAATRTYARDHQLPFDIFVARDPQAVRSAYRLPGVPETIHAGLDGRVRGAWLGVLPADFAERFADAGLAATSEIAWLADE
ncbi:MAG: redoxin domain-containing protein, partial [Acidobacteriota bacterium]